MSEPAVYLRHAGGWTEIQLPELLRMVYAAQALAEAALIQKIPEARVEGEQIFQCALRPSPAQGKAILAAHLLRYLMDDVDARRTTILATATAVPDSAPPAAPPAGPPPLPCAGKHTDDLPCDECVEQWTAARDAALAKKAAAAAQPSEGAG